jgi:WD40 repeat protein
LGLLPVRLEKFNLIISKGHNGWVTSLTVGSDANNNPLLISGSRDRSIIVWKLNLDAPEEIPSKEKEGPVDFKVGKPFKSLKGHAHFVSSLALARDNKHLVSSSWGKILFIYLLFR